MYMFVCNIIFPASVPPLQVLQSEIVAREPTVSSLNEAGNKLMASSTDEPAATEIKEDIDKLNRR